MRKASASSGTEAKAESISVTVTRAEYTERTINSSLINGNVAYLKISQFTDTNAEQFNTLLAQRIKEGAVGIVIDLRRSISGMASMLDTLLPAGNTVSYRNKAGKVTVERTSNANEVSLPITVIVDRNTFGAAEIFASDIKDYKKGLLVGEKTAGFGTKDEVMPLSDGSAIIISVANYLTLNGDVFSGKGIDVDVSKQLSDAQQALLVKNQLSGDQDTQLQAAVSALIRRGANVSQAPGSTQEAPAASGTATD